VGIVYSLYDALVSIKVPDEKAKAVIDALEREMMDKLATKADITHAREVLSRDLQAVQVATSNDLKHSHEGISRDVRALQIASNADLTHLRESISKDLRNLSNRMTIKLGSISIAGLCALYWLLNVN
jgi:hypothetical protein